MFGFKGKFPRSYKNGGAKFSQISDYLHLLIARGKDLIAKLENLTGEDSDINYKAKPTPFDQKMAEEKEKADEFAEEQTDRLLEELEKIRREKEQKEEDAKKEIENLPKPPEDWVH